MQFFLNTTDSQELWIIILNYFVEKRSLIRHLLYSSLILVKLEGDVFFFFFFHNLVFFLPFFFFFFLIFFWITEVFLDFLVLPKEKEFNVGFTSKYKFSETGF